MSYTVSDLPLRVRNLVNLDVLSDDCWVWHGRRSRNGYGRIRIDGREIAVHRLVWQVLVDSLGAREQLDHTCRNRACINPAHLEPVTNKENARRRDRAAGELAVSERNR